jgi:RNA polymerase sigma-B factor
MALTERTGLSTRDSLHMIETGRLWSLRASGGQAVREELVHRFLPLARRVATRYVGPTEPLDDLLQVAHLGLIGAVERFDSERGTEFPAFAIPTMVGELKRHFRRNGWAVHVPRGAQELALEVRRGAQELSRHLGRSPRVPELAQYLERDLDEIVAALATRDVQYATSLDAPVGNASATPTVLADTLGVEDDGYALVDAAATLRAEIPPDPARPRHPAPLTLGARRRPPRGARSTDRACRLTVRVWAPSLRRRRGLRQRRLGSRDGVLAVNTNVKAGGNVELKSLDHDHAPARGGPASMARRRVPPQLHRRH